MQLPMLVVVLLLRLLLCYCCCCCSTRPMWWLSVSRHSETIGTQTAVWHQKHFTSCDHIRRTHKHDTHPAHLHDLIRFRHRGRCRACKVLLRSSRTQQTKNTHALNIVEVLSEPTFSSILSLVSYSVIGDRHARRLWGMPSSADIVCRWD